MSNRFNPIPQGGELNLKVPSLFTLNTFDLSLVCNLLTSEVPITDNAISHAPGYQIKFWPKIPFSKLFEINLKLCKFCTRGCIYDIKNKILQKKLVLLCTIL